MKPFLPFLPFLSSPFITVITAVSVFLVLQNPAPAADENPATAKAPKPSTQPATATTKQDKDKDEDKAIPKKLLEAARQSFVICEYWYRKDLSDSVNVAEQNYEVGRIYSNYVDKKRPAERVGVVISDKGLILVGDDGIEDRFIRKIEVRDAGGKRYPARRVKLLLDAPGMLLQVDTWAIKKLRPLKFAQIDEKGADTKLLRAALSRSEDQWRIIVRPLSPQVKYAPDKTKNIYYGYRSGGRSYGGRGAPDIIAAKDGSPVGCVVGSSMDLNQTECVWKGADLIRAEGMDWDVLNKATAKYRKKLMAAATEVVLKFRAGSGDMDDEPSYRRSHYGSEAAGREIRIYGVAITPTEILVPRPLNSEMAKKIDKIYVKLSPTKRLPASFAGAYKKFAAFLVKLDKGVLPASIPLADKDPVRMRPFWAARIRKRFGKKYVDLIPNRLLGKTRGYAGRYHWYSSRDLRKGSMLVDFQGRLVGMYLTERIEHEEEKQLTRSRSYYGREQETRIFLISELRDALKATGEKRQAHMDPKIKVKPPAMAKRRTWLGVEYVAINSDLAEQFNVEQPTKDGQLGFVVNAVYAGSPAARGGIKIGDILLRIQAPGRPLPYQLLANRRRGGSWGRYRSWGYMDNGEIRGDAQGIWKSRTNFLTQLLDRVGIGKTVKIHYHRPSDDGKGAGKTMAIDYKIEQAPTDFDSAPKWKNRKLGLTVKNLTYEVRHALNLKPDAPGVIVAKTEFGSAVQTARIYRNEIITRLNDKPLTSARQMRDLIAQLCKKGEQKVRLTIVRIGRTRFADLTITDYDPAKDEGLDEKR